MHFTHFYSLDCDLDKYRSNFENICELYDNYSIIGNVLFIGNFNAHLDTELRSHVAGEKHCGLKTCRVNITSHQSISLMYAGDTPTHSHCMHVNLITYQQKRNLIKVYGRVSYFLPG